jgi:hypothetical protein
MIYVGMVIGSVGSLALLAGLFVWLFGEPPVFRRRETIRRPF